MSEHLNKAHHNHDLYGCMETSFKDIFCDWQITLVFYIALHMLQDLADSKGIDIGATHTEVEKNVNPKRYQPAMAIKDHAWKTYKRLYSYSCTARYEGFTDHESFKEMMQEDLKMCLEEFEEFRLYIKSQGINVDALVI